MHWTSGELIEALYGLREPDTHLEECTQCKGGWEGLRRARCELRVTPQLPQEFLAAQWRCIEQRRERRESRIAPALPALAAAAMVLIGIVLLRPAPRLEPLIAQGGEGKLYMEIYEQVVAADEEPRAAVPIRALFEDRAGFEDQ